MPSQGFSVDTTKLLEVAETVHRLREDLAGAGSAAGSLPNYQAKAGASILTEALATFWDRTDVFANAYDVEHQGIVATMQSMLSQLEALETACRNTAEQYSSHEHATKTTVSRSDQRTW